MYYTGLHKHSSFQPEAYEVFLGVIWYPVREIWREEEKEAVDIYRTTMRRYDRERRAAAAKLNRNASKHSDGVTPHWKSRKWHPISITAAAQVKRLLSTYPTGIFLLSHNPPPSPSTFSFSLLEFQKREIELVKQERTNNAALSFLWAILLFTIHLLYD